MSQHRFFDIHVHIFPDHVAAKAIPYLSERSGVAPTYDGTLAGLTASMQRAGIDGALNCPIATKPDQVRSINDWAASCSRMPVLSLGTMHPGFPEPEKELKRVRDLGLPGIKLHPEYQEFRLDDPRLRPVWKTCRDLNLLVLLHAGADIVFPPPYRSDPFAFRKLVEAWPGLTVVAAHFGGWKMWDAVRTELAGSPVYLDLSFTFGLWPDEKVVEMIREHGVERVLFGTDAPWRDQAAEVRHFTALPLSPADRSAIAWENAARLLGLV